MSWFERHRLMLCRLCLVVWVAAFSFAALQGCLGDAGLTTGSTLLFSTVSHHEPGHHHEDCVQLCDATNTAFPQIHAQLPAPVADQLGFALLLILPLFLLPLAGETTSTWDALRWPPSPRQPIRLRFVRFNN